ncbi:hypothetical protein [Acinetobacter bouvetii]|uniref:Uncharacterized protein n=1 Tax=Acinetobacter bouvetii TaxID=202951 RepID=A0A811GCJ0_9GAMM|nr:hypothetical protein [Acinetobacter bouvetii]CAB1216823.1 hypothetical protein SFB21_2008 [Acinetobacter bouvetii]
MLKPHHIAIVDGPFKFLENFWMIPELLTEVDDEFFLDSFSPYLLNTSGQDVKYGYQFVVKNRDFYTELNKTNRISYLIAADDSYFQDLPLFFEDQWDSALLLSDMILIGWTVNKFTEPAFLFGIYPIIKKDSSFEILSPSSINQWGLIPNHKKAKEIANENTLIDNYSEIWRPLAVYVDKYSFKKIISLG